MNTEPRQRVFFALLPGERERALLADTVRRSAERSGGRGVREANLHVTLAFIGEVGAAQVAALREIGAATPFVPFVLRFDRVQYRRRQAMVWIACGECPPALGELAASLNEGLARRGFRVEARPFVPHVTAVRRARRAPRVTMEALDVEIGGFALMRSCMEADGVRYERVDGWPA